MNLWIPFDPSADGKVFHPTREAQQQRKNMVIMLMLLLVCLWLEASPVKWGAQPHFADPVSCPERQHSLTAKPAHQVHRVI